MKILYHHRTQGRGAEGVHIREIVKALKGLGHEVFLVQPPGVDVMVEDSKITHKFMSGGGKKNSLNIAKIWKFVSKYMPQIGFELFELVYNLLAYRNIEKLLKKEKIDFIYERYHFFGWAGTKIARRYNLPIILEVNEVSGIKRVRGQVLVNLANTIEQKVFNNANAVIVVSNFLKRHVEHLGINSEKMHIIPNAVNQSVFNPDRVNCSTIIERFNLKNKIMLGFVGGFVKWHNFNFLLEVFAEIIKEEMDKNIRLFLVGDGPLRTFIEEQVRAKGLNEFVIFSGSISHSEIPKYIKAMDVCIIPHSNEYRSPIKMFEYMAMGKPVIAPKLKPIEDVLEDGINALLFKNGAEKSFKEGLIALINDKNKRELIGAEARKKVLSKHLWHHNAEKIINIYDKLKRK